MAREPENQETIPMHSLDEAPKTIADHEKWEDGYTLITPSEGERENLEIYNDGRPPATTGELRDRMEQELIAERENEPLQS